jgi:hypothetical protein
VSQQTTLRAIDATLQAALYAAGLADDATYTPVSGNSQPCKVFIDRAREFNGFESEAGNESLLVTALLAQILAVPRRGATFIINSVTYTVDRVLAQDESRVVCVCTPPAAA